MGRRDSHRGALVFSEKCCGFPALIAIITVFFTVTPEASSSSLLSALILTLLVVLSVAMTLLVSRLLSGTLLRGLPSAMALELPSFRRPQIGKVIVRSVFDRTLFVLGRAVMIAAPAGLIIWCLANITVGGVSVLSLCTDFLDPVARLFGMDGIILMAFILGSPANEIVLPAMIMAYTASGSLIDLSSMGELKALLTHNGWTPVTAVCVLIFFLMHWPCTTTLMTIKKETGSIKWTVVSFLVPLVCGLALCFIINSAAGLLGLA